VAGLVVFGLSAARVLATYLVGFPGELWQLDLEVYRDGAASLVGGRPVYEWLTGVPQFLPFTYPPFAALATTPLLLVPFAVAGWVWSLLQVGLLWVCAGIAFRPFLDRFGECRGLVHGLVAAVLVQLQPVQDGIRFGQVNAVVVTLCLADVARRSDGWWPRGSLVGLATAVKLTPATFWVHYAVARRWRTLAASVGAAAAATLLTGALSPSSTVAYWTDALLDPARLGPNDNVSNQSVRGALMRVGPSSSAAQTAIWLVLVALVSVAGFRLSARLDRLGEPVAVVAAVGMVAVLASPVSWIHHWHWGIVVIGALLGDARGRRRVGTALAATVVLALKLPWWGGAWPGHGPLVTLAGRLCEQAYTLFAVGSLVALWWVFAARQGQAAKILSPAGSARGAGT
jgi:alpha-1,2-mannosyltransferase